MKGFHELLESIAKKLFPVFFTPEDPSRRRFIATTSKAALYPVLHSVVPEVLTSKQYTEESLKTAESLYRLGRKIKFLKNKELTIMTRELQEIAFAGEDISEVVGSLQKNRDEIELSVNEFHKISQRATADSALNGWQKPFFEGEEVGVNITPDGITITEYEYCYDIEILKAEGFTAPTIKTRTIEDSAGTREGLLELINVRSNEMRQLRVTIDRKDATAASLYELASHLPNKGQMKEFGFGQDSISWRDSLRRDAESPYANRYR